MIGERVLNGRYRVDSPLGAGGMAQVFCATDLLLNRKVAVKVLRPHYAEDEEFVRRFYREAQSAAQLLHPNIVSTFDVGSDGDAHYIVMEYVDGETLAEQLRDGPLPERVALEYGAQIADGLREAHAVGLLHRDVKPANVLVAKNGVAKLSDFGLARAFSGDARTMMTQPGTVLGSVAYFSPEQAQGLELQPASDLYSLGVVLFQMLTGRLPFEGDSPVSTALKHVTDPVPSVVAAGVAPAPAAIVERLLQKEPNARFASAADLSRALRSVSGTEAPLEDAPTIVMPAVSPPARPPRRAKIAPVLAAGVASGLAASAALASHGKSWYARTFTPERRALFERHVADGFARLRADAGRTRAGIARQPAEYRWGAVALAVLLLIALVAGLAKPRIAVGSYARSDRGQAERAIRASGLEPLVVAEASRTVPSGRVIDQSPPPGTRLHARDTVRLRVSSGLPIVAVPNVAAVPWTEARRRLEAAKFTPKFYARLADAPVNSVIDQSPRAGTKAREGSTVYVIVSMGPQPRIIIHSGGDGGGGDGDGN